MKKLTLILMLILFYTSATAKDKYVGSGNLQLHDIDIDNFMKYLSAPAGQYPMIFLVISENGKSIWSTYWYCPTGNCLSVSKAEATKRCVNGAEKYYKKSKKNLECSIFAKKKVVVWDNDINPGKFKTSSFSSKWDKSLLKQKFSELGFETYK
tara:strand:- start:41 stop:499 length:459 start_codon:yes stop_codon:yes gene_type:complete